MKQVNSALDVITNIIPEPLIPKFIVLSIWPDDDLIYAVSISTAC